MQKLVKLIFIVGLLSFVQSCASLQCEELRGEEKKACVARVSQANLMNAMMSNQALMIPPPVVP